MHKAWISLILSLIILIPVISAETNAGDLNEDGTVNLDDILIIIQDIGKTTGYDNRSDRNNDGKINIFDLVLVAKYYGTNYTESNQILGLVAAYAFDEGTGLSTTDESGNGYTGTIEGPTWTSGIHGQALSFDGTNDEISITSSLDIPTLPLTFEAWINPTDYNNWRVIFSKRDESTESQMRFDIGLATGTGNIYLFTGSETVTFNYVPSTGKWTHIAIVANASDTKLYVNGTLQQTLGAVSLGTLSTAEVNIGRTGDAEDPFYGKIDEVKLYNRTLTQAEIQTDMNISTNSSTDSEGSTGNNEPSELSPIVYRPFNTKASDNNDRGTGTFPNKTGGSEGWDGIEYQYNNFQITTDNTAPQTPPNTSQITYPVGLAAGTGPVVVQTQPFTGNAHGNLNLTELYTKTHLKLGPNYHAGSVSNKLYFHRTQQSSPRPEPFLALHNNGDNTFTLAANFQGTPDNGLGWFMANGNGTTITKEQWYQIETYLKINDDPSTANGIFRTWVDNELVIERTNVNYTWNTNPLYWNNIHIAPTYGGTSGNPNPTEFNFYLDEIHISGKEDTTPPTITNPQPSGTLTSGTTNTTISINTNEQATCKYDTTDTNYDSMTNTFTTTGGTTHNNTITGLTDGNTYTYYTRCQDTIGNTNTQSTTINFDVAYDVPAINEPSGFIQLTEHTFTSQEEDGWYVDGGSPSIISDSSAPESPSSVARATYSSGFSAGSAPVDVEYAIPGSPEEVYVRYQIKLSNDWYGEDSGTNKIMFTWINNNPTFFTSAEGVGTGNLILNGRIQNSPANEYYPPNVGPSAQIVRGQWHQVEYYLKSNTGSNSDGILKIWFDGVLTHEYTNIQWNNDGGKDFQYQEWNPIWGGTSGTVPSTQHMDIDNVYISENNTAEVTPTVSMDFSQYSSTSELINDCTTWGGCVEDQNTNLMSLDSTVQPPGATKSMRYHFNHGNDGCTSITIKRELPLPQAEQEVWAEFNIRWSSNFRTTNNNCPPNDHKLIFGDTEGGSSGRWAFYVGADTGPNHTIQVERPLGPGGLLGAYYLSETGPSNDILASELWDGQWHKIQLYYRHSTTSSSDDGAMKVWIDGTLWHNETGFNTQKSDGSPDKITGFSFHHNKDDGPPNEDMYTWFGPIEYYTEDPNW